MRLRKNKPQPEQGRERRQVRQGSSVSPAFSYYASRTPETTARRPLERQDMTQTTKRGGQGRLHLPRSFVQLPFWLLLAVVAVCVVKVLALSTNPKVIVLGNTAVAKNYVQSADIYTVAAHKLLTSSITNRSKLTINLDGTAQSLQRQFPELQTVSLGVPLVGSRPIVYVQVAAPSLVLQTSGGNFALNKSGVVLARLRSVPAQTPIVVDQSGTPSLGMQFLPSSTVSFIQTLAYQLSAAHLSVSAYTLPVSSPYELDLHLASQTYTIRCNLQANAQTQSGAIIATVQQLGATVPTSYLDVRVPDRVYYK